MPGHHRAKAIGYDDDDIYDEDEGEYEEEGGDAMTEEDREQMRVCTIQVKEALGASVEVTDAQIQESLWHYYYDVGKTATYLKNKHAPSKPKPLAQPKKKTTSRFDEAASSAAHDTKATSGLKSKPTHKPNGDKLVDSVDKLTVEETPRVKSKNLNVLEEFRKSGMKRMASFVVIGHVDHGKSTLMGRLLYDLKVIDQRSVDKLKKEAQTIGKSSFHLAWVMDETSEERSRGVTIDIATNYFETEKTMFTILDAPGHRDFIPNMIAGASQADFAILVIDASTNSFEAGLKGQTKEHCLLVRSMGVQRLVIAVNKMDTVSWSQERFDDISQQMLAFLTAANFVKKNITFIPCAGLTGENVTRKIADPNAKWYTRGTLVEAGETAVEAINAVQPTERIAEKPLRMTIDNVFRGGIQNPISISGRIDTGTLQIGDTITAMPANETAIIKAIEVADEPVDWVVAGQIPTLHLADIDPVHLRLGDVVCDPKFPVKLTKRFTCKMLAFEHVFPMAVDVYRGRLQAEGKVRNLEGLLNKFTGETVKKNPRIVKPGEVARVVVVLERELPLEAGTRIVLRAEGSTVAAGLLEG
ncbi:elongation factor EF-1 alpha subunit [Clohesyomyces aquaticus]|uniref:Elongation factor 1 alpha-like protein n=1 Tax=Clohesyomyces aquaticus TaxID=1231657 RepID=A0A1Y1Y4U3_9PLEO|nr:elongation factor EF-1 alpha subunit [Clohesyomyces aquaticus]